MKGNAFTMDSFGSGKSDDYDKNGGDREWRAGRFSS